MPNLGAGEILVILLVALLVLGPDKLPAAARSVGKTMAQVRRLSRGLEDEVRGAMRMAEMDTSSAAPRSAPPTGEGLHPGLGTGPKLDAGAIHLDGAGSGSGPAGSSSPSTGDAGAAGPAGPTESFS